MVNPELLRQELQNSHTILILISPNNDSEIRDNKGDITVNYFIKIDSDGKLLRE